MGWFTEYREAKEEMDNKKTILLAEDTEELRELMAQSLELVGHKVITANNGMEALRLFKENHIDAIITDREMPMMNGIQLVTEIRKLDTNIPIVMWSGSQNPKMKDLTAFFQKEHGTKPLISMITELLKEIVRVA